MTRSLTRLLEDYLAHLSVERGVSAHTSAAYRRDLTRYLAYLAATDHVDITGVRPQDVEQYVEVLRLGTDGGRPLSPASTSRAIVAVRGLHRFAVLEGHREDDPAAGVRPPAGAKRLPKAISVAEVERLLEAASASEGPAGLRDRALLELLYSTGARISEAVALAVDDLDLDAENPVVRLFGKGRQVRVVPVGSHATRAVGAYLVRARPVLASRGVAARPCSSDSGERRCPGSPPGRCCRLRLTAPTWMRTSRRTPCAILSPRTCWQVAPTCAWSRSSSVMPP